MRRLWPVLAATMLALSGCGGDDTEPADVPAPPAAGPSGAAVSPVTEPTPAAGGGGTQAFVDTVRRLVPEAATDRRDDEIVAVAQQACTSLAAGEDADAVVAGTRSLGTLDAEAVDHATARELIKLAIDTVCPDQDRRVDEF
jgi:hypothetical protein